MEGREPRAGKDSGLRSFDRCLGERCTSGALT